MSQHLLLIIIVCVTAPRDVLINTAQLVMLVKDQLAHRLLTNIHRGGCGQFSMKSFSKFSGQSVPNFIGTSSCTALGIKETGTLTSLPQELKVCFLFIPTKKSSLHHS